MMTAFKKRYETSYKILHIRRSRNEIAHRKKISGTFIESLLCLTSKVSECPAIWEVTDGR